MRVAVDDPERGRVEMPGIAVNLSATPGRIGSAAPGLGDSPSGGQQWEPRPPKAALQPSAQRSTEGPLAGFRVLDLGMVIAGSFGGTLLAELGADVIKVEPPGGDSLRAFAPTWLGYNKGKRGVVIDLHQAEGREALLRLVGTADAVIDNYRPGVLERLGIDYASLRAAKPDIICISVTGYGEAGPLRSEPGFDPVLQSGSGMMLAQGGASGPTFLTLPVTDTPTALMGAFGACLALFHKLRTGEGQRVSTSLAALSVLMQSDEVIQFAGRSEPQVGSRDHPGACALERFYQTSDGWIRLHATREGDKRRLVEAGFLQRGAGASTFETGLAAAFASVTTAETLARLDAGGLVAAPAHRKFRDLFDGQDGLAPLDSMAEIRLANGKRVWAAGRYASFSRTQVTRVTVPPGLGEHTREILGTVGYGESELDEMIAAGIVKQGGPFAV